MKVRVGLGVEGILRLQGVLAGFHSLDDAKQTLYTDLVLALLAKDLREKLEALLDTKNYVYQSDFAKKYIAIGEAEGETKGALGSILKILAKRGILVTSAEETTMKACTDLAVIDTWLERSITALSAYEVLHGKPAPKKRTPRTR